MGWVPLLDSPPPLPGPAAPRPVPAAPCPGPHADPPKPTVPALPKLSAAGLPALAFSRGGGGGRKFHFTLHGTAGLFRPGPPPGGGPGSPAPWRPPGAWRPRATTQGRPGRGRGRSGGGGGGDGRAEPRRAGQGLGRRAQGRAAPWAQRLTATGTPGRVGAESGGGGAQWVGS